MKRLLGSLQVLCLVAAMPLAVSAQSNEDCEPFHIELEDGTHLECNVEAASDEWCYYDCNTH